MRHALLILFLLSMAGPKLPGADAPQPSEADARREAAVAEFTAKMKAANYPALFAAAAREFNVPADILKGVAFAETRWEHLTWPPGEVASPETGMPRPYGIMSLWDNEHFGHSLIQAAELIHKTPEELKQDPYQNIRGGAALLRKIYDETPKPPGTSEADLESWRYAIRKYSGIPEAEYNSQHALDVYVFMSRGYHQYGIEWDARPVNLEPIREETRKIVAEERAKRETARAQGTNGPASAIPQLSENPRLQPEEPLTNIPAAPVSIYPTAASSADAAAQKRLRFDWMLLLLLAVFVLRYLIRRWYDRSKES